MFKEEKNIQAFEDETVLFPLYTHSHTHLTHTHIHTHILAHTHTYTYTHTDNGALSFKALRENDFLPRSLCSGELTMCVKENKK